ncbi:hypothetical protein SCLARK_001695 [Spiroplasma clarkii]|nr:hypothetical protein SCLARK_001695 [Spiroplasma clarkii]
MIKKEVRPLFFVTFISFINSFKKYTLGEILLTQFLTIGVKTCWHMNGGSQRELVTTKKIYYLIDRRTNMKVAFETL